MNDLKQIVSTLSTDEQQQFISYLERKNKRNDTKNIQLFKLLSKQELDSKSICLKLYNDNKKDAYHALRKRLYQSIIDFIANTNLSEENSVNMQIIKLILASRTFLYNRQYKVAYKLLDKAEVLANEQFLFPYLNEIYHAKIQYAHTNPEIDLNKLIITFKNIQKKHFLEEELNIVYAKIRTVITNITYKGDVVDFETMLSKTLEEHNIDLSDSMSFKSLYQLITIVSISAFATNDYLKTEFFLINTYQKIKTLKDIDKQPFYHIQVLYLIANTLFRNKKFKESLNYLQLMHDQMHQNRKKYYNTFKLKYNLLLGLNYNYNNRQDQAINILEKFIIKKHPDIESLLDIYLSLIMIYFQKTEYQKAHHIFSKFYHTDKWYSEKAGVEWTIKKNLIEILLHLELDNIDLFESRLLSFKRNYYNYLKDIKQKRVITYLGLVEDYYKHPEKVTAKSFYDKVEDSFEWIGANREDIFVMSFYAWLKSKMEQRPLFETTLQLIKKAQNVN